MKIMNNEGEAGTQEFRKHLQEMESRLTACVETKVGNAMKATYEKVEKGDSEVMAGESKEASNAHTRAPNKTMSDIDIKIRKKSKK